MSKEFTVDTLKIFVTQKDKVPTIHFAEELMGIKCSFRIDKIEYVNSFEDEKKVNDEADLEFIVSILGSKNYDFPEISTYELARRTWNLNNKIKIPWMEMPNYMELK